MKFNRWIALPIALVAAIAIGIAAVQAAPSPSPSSGTSGKNYAQVFVDKLAAILGLNSSTVKDAMKNAELQTVDQMLADGRITKAQADALKARINAGQGLGPVGGFAFPRGGFPGRGFGGPGALRGLMTAELNAAASALHMSQADLLSALRSGKTLSQLETQQNVSDSAVKTAMKNAAKGVLDPLVKNGTITQAQENSVLSGIDAGKFGRFGGGPHFKRGAPPQTPNQSPAPTPAAYYSTI